MRSMWFIATCDPFDLSMFTSNDDNWEKKSHLMPMNQQLRSFWDCLAAANHLIHKALYMQGFSFLWVKFGLKGLLCVIVLHFENLCHHRSASLGNVLYFINTC